VGSRARTRTAAGVAALVLAALSACTTEEDNRGGIFGDRPGPRDATTNEADVDASDARSDALSGGDASDAADEG
jgi:hypothetical protein